jgi:hypothetical protein
LRTCAPTGGDNRCNPATARAEADKMWSLVARKVHK